MALGARLDAERPSTDSLTAEYERLGLSLDPPGSTRRPPPDATGGELESATARRAEIRALLSQRDVHFADPELYNGAASHMLDGLGQRAAALAAEVPAVLAQSPLLALLGTAEDNAELASDIACYVLIRAPEVGHRLVGRHAAPHPAFQAARQAGPLPEGAPPAGAPRAGHGLRR